MKNLIKNLSNTQKKILAVFLTITLPVWMLPYAICGLLYVGYLSMCSIVGVDEDA